MYDCVYVLYYLHVHVLVADSNGDILAGSKSKTSHTTGAGKKTLSVTKGTYVCAYT